ncbi:MAG: hypothetical protein SGARI_006673, partial [Bacillariaceae sp.]
FYSPDDDTERPIRDSNTTIFFKRLFRESKENVKRVDFVKVIIEKKSKFGQTAMKYLYECFVYDSPLRNSIRVDIVDFTIKCWRRQDEWKAYMLQYSYLFVLDRLSAHVYKDKKLFRRVIKYVLPEWHKHERYTRKHALFVWRWALWVGDSTSLALLVEHATFWNALRSRWTEKLEEGATRPSLNINTRINTRAYDDLRTAFAKDDPAAVRELLQSQFARFARKHLEKATRPNTWTERWDSEWLS